MSAPDEFDPMIERLFARSPALPDAEAFARTVEQKLERGWNLRSWALGAAGTLGALIAVRETVASGLALNLGDRPAAAPSGPSPASALWGDMTGWIEGGLMTPDLSAMTGMQLFWLLTAGLIAAAAITALRAVNEG